MTLAVKTGVKPQYNTIPSNPSHIDGSITPSCLINDCPKRRNLDSSKLKEFTDDNFRFDENGRKFCKRVENTFGKGKIARYEQFLLFPNCFQRLVLQVRKDQGLFGKA